MYIYIYLGIYVCIKYIKIYLIKTLCTVDVPLMISKIGHVSALFVASSVILILSTGYIEFIKTIAKKDRVKMSKAVGKNEEGTNLNVKIQLIFLYIRVES